jgi:DNA-binding MarR family transcriptional regulator
MAVANRDVNGLARPRPTRSDTLLPRQPEKRDEERAVAVHSVLDLERYVPHLVMVVASKFASGSSRLYRQHFGLGTTEWRIMALLAVESWITPQRVCQVIGFDKAAVSRSVRVLSERGWVAVRPNRANARSFQVTLTDAGRRLHDRIIRVALERERRLLSSLAPQEVEQLRNMLNRMHRSIAATNSPIEIPSEGD